MTLGGCPQPNALHDLLHAFATRPCTSAPDPQLAGTLRALAADGHNPLPLPGQGATMQRWQSLAYVAGCDLSLAKLWEAHTDALAIMAECTPGTEPAPGLWTVWAAEPPNARVHIEQRQGQAVRLSGRKAWCSGALQVDHALLTVWDEQGEQQLVALAMGGPGQHVLDDQWQAVGMAATHTVDLQLTDCPATLVGACGQYVNRPGFWHGAIGIAACWYGAASALAVPLRVHCQRPGIDVHALAHLGAVDAALAGARAVLHDSARWIDAQPQADASGCARRARAHVEHAVQQVIEHVGRALGAAPFCRNSHFARLAADLPVFIRQSHAERDLAELGLAVVEGCTAQWPL